MFIRLFLVTQRLLFIIPSAWQTIPFKCFHLLGDPVIRLDFGVGQFIARLKVAAIQAREPSVVVLAAAVVGRRARDAVFDEHLEFGSATLAIEHAGHLLAEWFSFEDFHSLFGVVVFFRVRAHVRARQHVSGDTRLSDAAAGGGGGGVTRLIRLTTGDDAEDEGEQRRAAKTRS
jgi:hypothetical protein